MAWPHQYLTWADGAFGKSYSPLTLVVQVAPRDLGRLLSPEGLPDPIGKWDKGDGGDLRTPFSSS